MTKLLLRLFIKDYRSTEVPAVRLAIGKLAGIVGIICNILLFAGKLVIGLITGSVSTVADAVNNLSDAASSVVTLLGFRMAQQPADKDHPYGHARYEYLSGLIVAALILLIGVELAKNSVAKMIDPVSVTLSAAAYLVLLCSIGIKLWMAVFFGSLGKRIESTSLKAAAIDSRNDVIVSIAVLAGYLVQQFADVNIDGYVGLAVALFILYSGFGIAKETISPLLGKQADTRLIECINELVLSHDKILGVHDLLVHDYGPGRYFASVHVEFNADEDPIACHDIIDHIECDALTELNVHLVIHYDPVQINDEEWNRMRGIVEDIIQAIDQRLSMHDFRLVKSPSQTKLVFDLAVPYELNERRQEFEQSINEALPGYGPQYVAVIHFDNEA